MLDNDLKEELINIFSKYEEIERVVIFGSRARGDYKKTSDIDICLFGDKVDHAVLSKVWFDIEEINTYLSFDIVNYNELVKKELINNIVKEGIEIYNEQTGREKSRFY